MTADNEVTRDYLGKFQVREDEFEYFHAEM